MAQPPHTTLGHRYDGESPVRTLFYLFEQDRRRVVGALCAYLVKHTPIWVLPLVTANVVDVLVRHRGVTALWWNGGVLLLILCLNLPSHMLYVRWMSGSIRRMGVRLRSALCHRMQELSIGYFAEVSAGVLQAKVIRDVEGIETTVQQTVDMGMASVATMLGALVVIGIETPLFLPIFLVVVPASALLVARLRERLRSNNESFRNEVEHLSSRVIEMTTLIPITRAHALERTAMRRIERTLGNVLSAGLKLDLLNGMFGALAWILLNIIGVACLIGSALIAYYGVFGVTAGQVVMLSAYFASLTGSLISLMTLTPVIGKGLASVTSVGEVLQAPDLEVNAGKDPVEEVGGHVRFEQVGYSYHPDDRPAVSGFDLEVSPGETIALVGPSGAGKSTILNLVIGFLRPTEGRILLDGRDMESLDLRDYRTFLSVVPQESILFEDTIRENVTYGMDGVSDERLTAALRDANALEFVRRLPLGIDTLVGERGARLSGGQKQRLAIARALIRDPRVLILDEATSALDSQSEALIQQALRRLIRGRTVFIVAHRLSTIRDADRIVVMSDSRIAEVGTHDELLRNGGVYSHLQAGQVA